MKFHQRLRLLRKQFGLTQEELGKKLGITPASIGLYEQGRRTPDNNMLIQLATLFNVSVDYLLGFDDLNTETKLYYNGSEKKSELKSLIDSAEIPDEKLEILISMLKSWSEE